MGHPTVNGYYLISLTMLVEIVIGGAELLMQQTNTNDRTCCGSVVTYTCTVSESSSLIWTVGSFDPVDYVSISSINTSDFRGNNGEYEFVLLSVAPNSNNPVFLDFVSTLTVTAVGAVNGTEIKCDDLINPSRAALLLNSTEQVLQVDSDCVTECPDDGGDVNITWRINSGLCGWDTIMHNVTIACTNRPESCPSGPTMNDISSSLNSNEVFFNQMLSGGDIYTFQIIASNLCGETSTQMCEVECREACESGNVKCHKGTQAGVGVGVGVGVLGVVGVGMFAGWYVYKQKKRDEETLKHDTVDSPSYEKDEPL